MPCFLKLNDDDEYKVNENLIVPKIIDAFNVSRFPFVNDNYLNESFTRRKSSQRSKFLCTVLKVVSNKMEKSKCLIGKPSCFTYKSKIKV